MKLVLFWVTPFVYPENIHHVQRLIFEKKFKSFTKTHLKKKSICFLLFLCLLLSCV